MMASPTSWSMIVHIKNTNDGFSQQALTKRHVQLVQRLCVAWLWFGLLGMLLGAEDALAASIGPWWFWACVPPVAWVAGMRKRVAQQQRNKKHGRIQAVRRHSVRS